MLLQNNIFIAVSSVLDKGLQWSPQNKDQPKLIKEPLPKQGAISVACYGKSDTEQKTIVQIMQQPGTTHTDRTNLFHHLSKTYVKV